MYYGQQSSDAAVMLYPLEPFLDIVEMSHGDRVDWYWRLFEIVEDKHHIEVFQTKLHSLQRDYFNLGQGDHAERRL